MHLIEQTLAIGHVAGIGALLAIAAAACDEDVPVETASATVVNGDVTADYPAVVALEFPDPRTRLSGVLIAQRIVITAAHGVRTNLEGGNISGGLVRFGPSVDTATDVVMTADAAMHRYYDVDTGEYYDIAVVLLAEDAPTDPLPVYTGSLDGLLSEGETLRLVAYGRSAKTAEDFGTKRAGDAVVSEIANRTIGFFEPGVTSCNGDSGGPYLLSDGGQELVVALVKGVNCRDNATATRIAPYWDEFIIPMIDKWTGPCPLDGTCTEDGCRTPDPDCDPCGFDGTCATDCATYDWDCPLRGRFGDPCVSSEDCESGICARDPGYPGDRFCTLPCSPRLAVDVCQSGMECVTDAAVADEPFCNDPFVPQPAGALCDTDPQCASGVCLDEGTCARGCADTECLDGSVCDEVRGQPICVPDEPPAGCGCQLGSPTGGGGPAVLLALLGVAGVRRRRRR